METAFLLPYLMSRNKNVWLFHNFYSRFFFTFLFSINTKHPFISGLEHWELIKDKLSVSSILSLLSTAICIDVVITIPVHAFFCAGETWAPSLLTRALSLRHRDTQSLHVIAENLNNGNVHFTKTKTPKQWAILNVKLKKPVTKRTRCPCLPGARDIYRYFVLLACGEVIKKAYRAVSSFLWFYCCDNWTG